MADLATTLLRTTVRAFYTTDHVLVIEALIVHSTLPDSDLAHVLGMQPKPLRRLCGRLREDGLLSVQTRAERRADGSGGYYGGAPQAGKERVTYRNWYYLNFHRAIDSIKYRMYRLSKHVESLGMPTTEKKDLFCPRCKSQYTELEVMDMIDSITGEFMCHRCGHALEPVEEDERANENESMKRLNSQMEKLLKLMQQIDATTVPENDFPMALSKQKPIIRSDTHLGAKTEVVDLPNRNLQSTKGLEIKPEKIAVQVQDDEDVKRENAAAEAAARREKEARQNALPDWIAKSTVTGDVTTVGAKEERLRREREAHSATIKEDDGEEKKPNTVGDDAVMDAYWKELAIAREKEAAEALKEDQEDEEDEEEDDEDDDEFEDVDVTGARGTPASNGPRNGAITASTGANTPQNAESSNATDDERDAKRARTEENSVTGTSSPGRANGNIKDETQISKLSQDTPAASDEDDDDLEFENV